jgi:hypothetical protein
VRATREEGTVKKRLLGWATAAAAAIVASLSAGPGSATAAGLHPCQSPIDNIYKIRTSVGCDRAWGVIRHVRCADPDCDRWSSRRWSCRHEPDPAQEGARFKCKRGDRVVKWRTRS